jgi:predicted Zn-dependent peptidase
VVTVIKLSKTEPSIAPEPIKQQSFEKSVKIATFDKQGPASSLAIFIKAGSKHDTTEKTGLAHLTLKSVFRVTNLLIIEFPR